MPATDEARRQQLALVLLRVTLGLILLATWRENLHNGLYTAEGLRGFFVNGVFAPAGIDGGPAWYRSLIEATVLAQPGLFASFQMVAELLLGLALLLGAFTRPAAVAAGFFFANLLLAYWGGREWIWTYVLLVVSALAVALSTTGRLLGLDGLLYRRFGTPRWPFLW
ncbi:MAG: DoxX family membrane protein [Anaerolineales bacterium]|nr:DoxX family membrane protein [Anaerolineales bacterium]